MEEPTSGERVVVREVIPWVRTMLRAGFGVTTLGALIGSAYAIINEGFTANAIGPVLVLVLPLAFASAWVWRALGSRIVLTPTTLEVQGWSRTRTVPLQTIEGMHELYTRGNESDRHTVVFETSESEPVRVNLGGALRYEGWATLVRRVGGLRLPETLGRLERGDTAFFGSVVVSRDAIEVEAVGHPLASLRELKLERGELGLVFSDAGWNVSVPVQDVPDRWMLMGLLRELAPHAKLPAA